MTQPQDVQAELRSALESARTWPAEDIEPAPTFTVGDVRPHPRTETRHLWAQELVRASLVIAFFVLLAVTVIWALFLAGGASWANAKEALQILLPAETGLLASAAGFYFRQSPSLTQGDLCRLALSSVYDGVRGTQPALMVTA